VGFDLLGEYGPDIARNFKLPFGEQKQAAIAAPRPDAH